MRRAQITARIKRLEDKLGGAERACPVNCTDLVELDFTTLTPEQAQRFEVLSGRARIATPCPHCGRVSESLDFESWTMDELIEHEELWLLAGGPQW